MEYCIQLWGCQSKKNMNLLEQVHRRSTRLTGGLEHLSWGDRLRGLWLFDLKKRRYWKGFYSGLQVHLKGYYRKAGEGLFFRACIDRKLSL